jgi:hypothetical protein
MAGFKTRTRAGYSLLAVLLKIFTTFDLRIHPRTRKQKFLDSGLLFPSENGAFS